MVVLKPVTKFGLDLSTVPQIICLLVEHVDITARLLYNDVFFFSSHRGVNRHPASRCLGLRGHPNPHGQVSDAPRGNEL